MHATYRAFRYVHHLCLAVREHAEFESILTEVKEADPEYPRIEARGCRAISTLNFADLVDIDAACVERVARIIAKRLQPEQVAAANRAADEDLQHLVSPEPEPAPEDIDLDLLCEALRENYRCINFEPWAPRITTIKEAVRAAPSDMQVLLLRAISESDPGHVRGEFEIYGVYCGYAEPGYTEPDLPYVFLGNWNRQVSNRNHIVDLIEAAGGETEWSDEWADCAECNHLVRTSPDSYSWKRSYWQDLRSGECVCERCTVKYRMDDYIAYLDGDHTVADTFDVDFDEHGYTRLDVDFERGLHPGQADNPSKIAKLLEAAGVTSYLFSIDSVGQFDTRFSVWVHKDQWVPDLLSDPSECRDEISPAQHAEAALRNIPAPTGAGVHLTTIDTSTGAASTRMVSPEEFIAGIK
jgi:hypothetical protein